MSYSRYLCLFAYDSVQHIVYCFSSFCVSYVASFCKLSIFDCPFSVFSNVYSLASSICNANSCVLL
jgi:hypothetical protein